MFQVLHLHEWKKERKKIQTYGICNNGLLWCDGPIMNFNGANYCPYFIIIRLILFCWWRRIFVFHDKGHRSFLFKQPLWFIFGLSLFVNMHNTFHTFIRRIKVFFINQFLIACHPWFRFDYIILLISRNSTWMAWHLKSIKLWTNLVSLWHWLSMGVDL